MGDVEIARATKLDNIQKIAEKIGVKEEELETYGLLKPGVKVVCETDNEEKIETSLKLLKEKRYGSKWLHIYEKEN